MCCKCLLRTISDNQSTYRFYLIGYNYLYLFSPTFALKSNKKVAGANFRVASLDLVF